LVDGLGNLKKEKTSLISLAFSQFIGQKHPISKSCSISYGPAVMKKPDRIALYPPNKPLSE